MMTNARTTSDTRITILMAVYNGADYLPAQLDSIAAQTHDNWTLIARDDGSTDVTVSCLEAFAKDHHTTILPHTPNTLACRASAANFLHLLRHAATLDPRPRWIAFSDQDDVWLPDKLARAQAALPTDQPALYCSRTWIVKDMTQDGLSMKRLSAKRPKPPAFENALVQNIASGNTILLNPAACDLVLAAAPLVDNVVAHDWWVYQIVTGAGGRVIHDDAPSLYYRQHGLNQIGANDTFRARLRRIKQLLRGDFKDWNRINVAALRASRAGLTPTNRAILEGFAALPGQHMLRRLASLRRLGLYRQTTASMIALWVAAAFGLL